MGAQWVGVHWVVACLAALLVATMEVAIWVRVVGVMEACQAGVQLAGVHWVVA